MTQPYRDDGATVELQSLTATPAASRPRVLWLRPSRRGRTTVGLLSFALVVALFHLITDRPIPRLSLKQTWSDALSSNDTPSEPKVHLVLASVAKDNTSWAHEVVPDWDIVRYVTDDPNATYSVPKNKGRETTVYLTYIIDHYDTLADDDIVVFHHADRYQWHNDDPLFDGGLLLSRMRLPYVREVGYANLRCQWNLGCDGVPMHPLEHGSEPIPEGLSVWDDDLFPWLYQPAFEAMLPHDPVPSVVAAPCCGQFAVTGSRILRRSVEDYQRVRQWMLDSTQFDSLTGRVMEYLWHILFGNPSLDCPPAGQCYCGLYGKCQLTCPEEGSCDGQVHTPTFGAVFPENWPEVGFDGAPQDAEQLRAEQMAQYEAGYSQDDTRR